jgi:carbon storage regulator
MLILKRRSGEQLIIGESIVVKVLTIRVGQVTLGVQAPREIAVDRHEVRERIVRNLSLKSAG